MRCYYRNTTFLPFAFFLHFRPNFIYNQLKGYYYIKQKYLD